MTNNKHTQGKWEIVQDSDCLHIQGQNRDWFIATVLDKDREANAKLIASAPLLYEYAKSKAELGCKEAQSMLISLKLTNED